MSLSLRSMRRARPARSGPAAGEEALAIGHDAGGSGVAGLGDRRPGELFGFRRVPLGEGGGGEAEPDPRGAGLLAQGLAQLEGLAVAPRRRRGLAAGEVDVAQAGESRGGAGAVAEGALDGQRRLVGPAGALDPAPL